MTISREDAAQALGEIETARGRVVRANAYAVSSPFFIVWGLVWLVGDTVSQFAPRYANDGWWAALACGVAASAALSFRLRSKFGEPARGLAAWRSLALWALMVLFFVGLFSVIPVVTAREVHSVYGVVFGFLYAAVGLWIGWRILALGLALTVLTLIGFFFVGAWYPLYMGLVGATALGLGGLWLRTL